MYIFVSFIKMILELNVESSYQQTCSYKIGIYFHHLYALCLHILVESIETENFAKRNSVPLRLQTTGESYENFILLQKHHLDIAVISGSWCVFTLFIHVNGTLESDIIRLWIFNECKKLLICTHFIRQTDSFPHFVLLFSSSHCTSTSRYQFKWN